MHNQYYELLEKQILADGIVTEAERRLAEKIAAALSLGPVHLRATRTTADPVTLQPAVPNGAMGGSGLHRDQTGIPSVLLPAILTFDNEGPPVENYEQR